MGILKLFNTIPTAGASSKHNRAGWVNVSCPYCDSGRHYHLGWNIKGQYFNCFSCGKKPLMKTLKLLFRLPDEELKELLKNRKKETIKIGKEEIEKKPFLVPEPLKDLRLLPHHKRYLKFRGFDWRFLSKYKVQGTTIAKSIDNMDLSWRLYIPVIQNGRVVTWQTRAIGKNGIPYLACPQTREKVSIKRVIYPNTISKNIILTEGLFDCWKVRKAGFPGCTGFGAELTPAQLRLLKNKNLVMFFDGDQTGYRKQEEIKDSIEFATNNKVKIVRCPIGTDPGKLKITTIRQLLKGVF